MELNLTTFLCKFYYGNIDVWATLLPAFLSGLAVYVLTVWRDSRNETTRKHNLLSGLVSEMRNNAEFAAHNHHIIQNKLRLPVNSVNLIFLQNNSAIKILAYSNIILDEKLREQIRKYVVAVEHINSILKDYEKDYNSNVGNEVCKYLNSNPTTIEGNLTAAINQVIPQLEILLKGKSCSCRNLCQR